MLLPLPPTASHTSKAGRAGTQVSDLASGAPSSPKASCRQDRCLPLPCLSPQLPPDGRAHLSLCRAQIPLCLAAILPRGWLWALTHVIPGAQVSLTHDAGLSVGKEGAC